jgi:signal peptidase I
MPAALSWFARVATVVMFALIVFWVVSVGGFSSSFIDLLARTPLSKVVMFVAVCSVIRLAVAPSIASVAVHMRGNGYFVDRVINEMLDAVIYAGVFVFLIIRPFMVQAFKIPSESMLNTLLVGDYIVANKAIYRYTNPKVGDIVVFRPPAWACTPDQVNQDTGEVNVDFIKRCQGVPGDLVEVRNGTLYRNGVAQQEPYIRDRMNNDFKLVKYRNQTDDPAWTSWLPKADPGLPDSESHRYLSAIWNKIAQGTPNTRLEYWPLVISENGVNQDQSYTAAPYHVNEDDTKLSDHLRDLPAAKVPPGYYLMMGDNRNGSFDGRAWGLVPRDDIIGRSEFIWFPVSRWRVTR